MDSTAIKLIQETAIDAETKRLSGVEPTRAEALPKDYQVVDTEVFQNKRSRFRGCFSTFSIADFVKYVGENKGGHGFVDGEELSATVFFNLGNPENPGHGDWTGKLELKATPAYSALHSANGKPVTQRQITDWMEDWAANLSAFVDDGDGNTLPVGLVKAVSAIRKVTIENKQASTTEVQNFRQQQSRLDSVEASSDAGLPDGFVFTCMPYQGLSSRRFVLRLQVLTGGDAPRLTLRIVAFEQHQEDIAQEFKALLIGEIGEDASMTIGTFRP